VSAGVIGTPVLFEVAESIYATPNSFVAVQAVAFVEVHVSFADCPEMTDEGVAMSVTAGAFVDCAVTNESQAIGFIAPFRQYSVPSGTDEVPPSPPHPVLPFIPPAQGTHGGFVPASYAKPLKQAPEEVVVNEVAGAAPVAGTEFIGAAPVAGTEFIGAVPVVGTVPEVGGAAGTTHRPLDESEVPGGHESVVFCELMHP